jgi:protein-S-isoprenylcysteine O-methyltransferase Ste14
MRTGIPPLALVGLLAVLMWLAARVFPQAGMLFSGRGLVCAATGVAGLVLCALGVLPFRRAGTTVDPTRPERASALVTTGIYSVSRNPMYLGMLLVIVAWGIYLANAAGLVLAPLAFVLYLDRVQIPREERALATAFGSDYAGYASRVRRWL